MIKHHDDVWYAGLDGPYIYVLEPLKEFFNTNSAFHILHSALYLPQSFGASDMGSTCKPLVSFLKLMVLSIDWGLQPSAY